MRRFLYLYIGGHGPDTDSAALLHRGAWLAYCRRLGPAILDPGGRLDTASDAGAPACEPSPRGFMLVQARDVAEAHALAELHPHRATGGDVVVLEVVRT